MVTKLWFISFKRKKRILNSIDFYIKDIYYINMRFLLSYLLYFIGDIISRTIMFWGDGYGFKIYNKVMLWSVDLDTQGKIWKYVAAKKKKKK